jgi:hypothetical protein
MQLILLASLMIPSPAPTSQDWLDRVLAAAQLPVAAAEAREEGVSNITLGNILDIIRRRGLPAEDARYVLEEEVRVVREGGPRENFGAFVQTQLDAGLRGRALADAIHEEHRRRGMGRPDDRGRDDRNGDRRGNDARPGEPGRGRQDEERARPNDARDRGQGARDTTKKERP